MHGILNLYKPCGMSSNFALTKVKKLTNIKKIGHLGTLDPLACGVLPVSVNKGTKLFDFYLKKTKVYRAVFTFSKETSTLDSEGEIVNANNIIPSEEEILKVLSKIETQTEQIPPNFCANSINGTKAYILARQGKNVELKSKKIKIYYIKLIKQINSTSFLFEIKCSSGTYIRSIARDLAKLLNTYAYMSALIRISSGEFQINSSNIIDSLTKENVCSKIIPLNILLDFLPKINLTENFYKPITNGMNVFVKGQEDNENVLVVCKNILIGIGKIKSEYLKIKVNLM